jgi:CheY-like chemotaxis protein
MQLNPEFEKFGIMVVDDSDFARTALTGVLHKNGFKVVAEARDGVEAMKLLREKKPHLVLTDIVMPEFSGIELTEKIMASGTHTGVIAISSLNQEQIILQAIAAGAIDFIAKPVDPLQLIEAVTKFLRHHAREGA